MDWIDFIDSYSHFKQFLKICRQVDVMRGRLCLPNREIKQFTD